MNKKYSLDDLSEVFIGYPSENATRTVEIDVTEWRTGFPNGNINILYSRPTEDSMPYLVNTEVEENIVIWHISNTDVEKDGLGYAVLQMTENTKILRSAVFAVAVVKTLKGSVSPAPPSPAPSWVQQILDSRVERFYISGRHLFVEKVDGETVDLGQVVSDGGSAEWGNIEGNIEDQIDLKNALDDKADVNSIPIKTSDLQNDSGFLTEHQSLSGYATEQWVESQGYITHIDDATPTSSGLMSSTDKTKLNTLNEHENDITVCPSATISELLTFQPLTNHKYTAVINVDCGFSLPTAESGIDNTILIYANFTEEISVNWGNDVLFYNDEIPTIEVGYYDIIFTYDPNATKWCVGVLKKGSGS